MRHSPDPFPDPYDPSPYGHWVPPDSGDPGLPGEDDPESDPLVPPPYGGLGPWYRRLVDTLGRSWQQLGLIFLITFAAPHVALAVLFDSGSGFTVGTGGVPLPVGDGFTDYSIGTIGLMLLVGLATAFLNVIGWAGGIWAVTEQAAGVPVTVGAALQAGIVRTPRLFGWYVVYGVIVAVGLFVCILPGIYLAITGALFSLVAVYERGENPLRRSFVLVHQAFGAAAGRVLLLFGCMLGVACASGAWLGFLGIVTVDEQGARVGSQVLPSVIEAAISLPVNMVLLVGLLLTYTQVRAREDPLSTMQLWQAANWVDADPPVSSGD